jgi:hypothetical protein
LLCRRLIGNSLPTVLHDRLANFLFYHRRMLDPLRASDYGRRDLDDFPAHHRPGIFGDGGRAPLQSQSLDRLLAA